MGGGFGRGLGCGERSENAMGSGYASVSARGMGMGVR